MKKAPLCLVAALAACGLAAALSASPADDLTVSKKMTVNGTEFTTQSLIKGPRERSTMQMGGMEVSTSIRQCDLHRTLAVQDSTKSFFVWPDVEESTDAKPAAKDKENKDGPSQPSTAGGSITYRTTVKDTGEHKQILGCNARHLKMTIVAEPSPTACNKSTSTYDIDGWYIDLKTVPGTCRAFTPVSSSSGDGGDSGG